MTSPEGDWLVCRSPRPNARIRLFCFPWSGVGASVFRRWPPGLSENIELWAIQNPGRENRIREEAWRSIDDLVDAIHGQLRPKLARPFALFGHSMGAVLASELARKLHADGVEGPEHLIVSGRRPPHIAALESPLYPLDDDTFVAELGRRYNGIPAAVQADKLLMAQLLPCLRADIEALERHQPTVAPDRSPLACPITVFGGTNDPLTPPEHLEAWRRETTGPFRKVLFEGDHFFLGPKREEVLAELGRILA